MAADVGEKTGTLSLSLTKVLQQSTDADRLLGTLLARIVYIMWIFCVLVFTLTFMMLKIVPTFAEMFSEFGLRLPMATQLLMSCSRFCAEYWYLLAPIVLFVGLVAVFLMLSYIGIPIRGLPGVEWFYAATERAAVLFMRKSAGHRFQGDFPPRRLSQIPQQVLHFVSARTHEARDECHAQHDGGHDGEHRTSEEGKQQDALDNGDPAEQVKHA